MPNFINHTKLRKERTALKKAQQSGKVHSDKEKKILGQVMEKPAKKKANSLNFKKSNLH